MARVLLVSANLGGLDPIFPLPAEPGVDSVYFTDQSGPAPGWGSVVRVTPRGNPRMEAKRYKCQINRLNEASGYDWLAWADASFRFRSIAFLPLLAGVGTDGLRAALIPHPDRETVADEYTYILRQIGRGNPYLSSRYPTMDLLRERAYFSVRHDLSRLPLWSGGLWLFARGPRSDEFFDRWWDTVSRFSVFDQAAISPLLVETGIEPLPYNVNLYRNWAFERVHHA